jgi:type 1 glutamine amidotransferase
MMMVIKYGKGLIFHTPMGHENGVSLQCVGFITTLNRACEWLATDKVTTRLPKNFPTADKVSVVPKGR